MAHQICHALAGYTAYFTWVPSCSCAKLHMHRRKLANVFEDMMEGSDGSMHACMHRRRAAQVPGLTILLAVAFCRVGSPFGKKRPLACALRLQESLSFPVPFLKAWLLLLLRPIEKSNEKQELQEVAKAQHKDQQQTEGAKWASCNSLVKGPGAVQELLI